MPDWTQHSSQAEHNADCAKAMLKDPRFLDWAVIAAFYAALHFVEVGRQFIADDSLNGLPDDDESLHIQRQNFVEKHVGHDCYVSYRKLRIASENARYLNSIGTHPGPMNLVFRKPNVEKLINEDLEFVRSEVEKASRSRRSNE